MWMDGLIEGALPVCVYSMEFATKHTKNNLKTNNLKYLLIFLLRPFWYNYARQNKETQNFLN